MHSLFDIGAVACYVVTCGLCCPLEHESYIFKQKIERNGSPVRLSKVCEIEKLCYWKFGVVSFLP